MKIMLIGANGQLGHDLVRILPQGPDPWEVVALTHTDIEITDRASIQRALDIHQPQVVLSTAAFHKLELCEEDAEKAFAVNAIGTRNLAMACRSSKAVFVFISTDYVFGGDLERTVPYQESDVPAPVNVYGISKLAGENFIRYLMDRYFIVRVSGLYGISGSSGKGGNFVELMLRLAREGKDIRVVNDQILTPTYTVDVALQIKRLLSGTSYGLYHATSQGYCSWHEFAAEIFRQAGLAPNLMPTSTPAVDVRVIRPGYSVLDNATLRKHGIDCMRPWQEALAAYLQERRLSGKI
jgi:dTDP-4-dehydrorhamnose reductase